MGQPSQQMPPQPGGPITASHTDIRLAPPPVQQAKFSGCWQHCAFFSARHTMVVQAGHLPPGPSHEALLALADVVLELGGHLFLSHTQILCLEGEHFANVLSLQAEDGPCVDWRGKSLPVVAVAPQESPPGGLSWLKDAEPHFQCLLRTIYRAGTFEVGAGAAAAGVAEARHPVQSLSLTQPSPSTNLTVLLGCAPLPFTCAAAVGEHCWGAAACRLLWGCRRDGPSRRVAVPAVPAEPWGPGARGCLPGL